MLNSKKVTLITLKCVLLFSANRKITKNIFFIVKNPKKNKKCIIF